ncbi:MAG: bifunctional diaminohydroxyphosphoribosylaminopyrimidine deaminase/5-amino-6-(5-phosphoribosylamino)uracil reductase RibD [Deltaproteobacteria bacterium]|nr:MAG: bifunctional diaminohydroxyphosphoribosylaminopyrimidine deaminase/5-amino-6-(5-phosphoribosylamino)uracil reductase RibD [Deltaproteobacteria bacterium]
MSTSDREVFIAKAIELARRAEGRTSPNPLVGAVVVQGGEIVGVGFHAQAGAPHAEIHALRMAAEKARGADLYVNLEPCCHQGRTPPCTNAIIAAGIRRVFIGILDPNPQVDGKGIAALRRAGIEVETGILAEACRRLNEAYCKFITTRLPFVTLKFAASLDGKIATTTGASKWISGEASRRFVHELRNRNDAISVGVGTILADDPRLTTRIEGGRDPLCLIFDSHLRTPPEARVFHAASARRVIIATRREPTPQERERFAGVGAEILSFPGDEGGVSIPHVLRELGKRDVMSLLVEGGGRLGAAFLGNRNASPAEPLADKFYLFLAPCIFGGDAYPLFPGFGIEAVGEAISLRDTRSWRLGEDLAFEGYFTHGDER